MQQNNKKRRIYPKKPSGKLYTYRKWVSYLLLTLLFACPFIKLNEEQLVLLNFIERKFVFFGLIFTPQDFYLFAIAMMMFIIFIGCFTVVFGRLWCGWACPQTIFMEMVFRRLEYWIEGDAKQQQKLNAEGWNSNKIIKKGIKHSLFLLISFAIANTFLAYMIGSAQLYKIITEPVNEHIVGFLSIWVFTFIFYAVFTHIREVVCTVICPYGRLQGVLLDNKSLIVAYNETRGEPRGHLQKTNSDVLNIAKGDCIDCGLCVQVCPTGIDIRKGTQLECVNCTACIDSCNEVMHKINKPTNLIGFYTQDFIKNNKPFKLSLRAYGYSVVFLLMMFVFSALVYQREDVQTTVLRASGSLYQTNADGTISNLYHASLINKTNNEVKYQFRSADSGDLIKYIQQPKVLAKEGSTQFIFFLIKDPKQLKKYKTDVKFEVLVNDKVISTAKTTFFTQP